MGHGRNDLALGPDGLIYSIHGDSVDVPNAQPADRKTEQPADGMIGQIVDRTSPFREARRGEKTSEGTLLRTDQGGAEVGIGLLPDCGTRSASPSISAGDLFTYDADAEFDMGSPWYRPTRVAAAPVGGRFWLARRNREWPPYYPDHADNALPCLDIGKGSPTAVAFGTGSKFPPAYQRALFILDWAYRRVLAVHLLPRGAGYRAQAETFLKGRPLNVTDLAVGPDGAMYFVTGGRKTQSALYRVAYVGPEAATAPLSQHEQECQSQAASARKLLRSLEELHKPVGAAAIETAWPHLSAADPVIRHAARIAIEHQPVNQWRECACRTAAHRGARSAGRAGSQRPEA